MSHAQWSPGPLLEPPLSVLMLAESMLTRVLPAASALVHGGQQDFSFSFLSSPIMGLAFLFMGYVSPDSVGVSISINNTKT